MIINFDTNSTNDREIRALIVFLSALLPPVNGQAPAAPSLIKEQLKASLAIEPAPGPVLVQSNTEPPAATAESTKRTRRTKAEMAADAAKAEAQRVAGEGHPEEAEAVLQNAGVAAASPQAVNGALKVISADELRALLNGYISRHSMEEAIEKLRAFGCNRVTEVLALESAKLNELAASLNG